MRAPEMTRREPNNLRRGRPGSGQGSSTDWPSFSHRQEVSDLLTEREAKARIASLRKDGFCEVGPSGANPSDWLPNERRFMRRPSSVPRPEPFADYFSLRPLQLTREIRWQVRQWRIWDDALLAALIRQAEHQLDMIKVYAREDDPQPPKRTWTVKPTKANPFPLFRTVGILQTRRSVLKLNNARALLGRIANALGYGRPGSPDSLELRGLTGAQYNRVVAITRRIRGALHPEWCWPGKGQKEEGEAVAKHNKLTCVSDGLLSLRAIFDILDHFASVLRASPRPVDRHARLAELSRDLGPLLKPQKLARNRAPATLAFARTTDSVSIAVARIAKAELKRRSMVGWWEGSRNSRMESWGAFAGRHLRALLEAARLSYTPETALTKLHEQRRRDMREMCGHLGLSARNFRAVPLPRANQVK